MRFAIVVLIALLLAAPAKAMQTTGDLRFDCMSQDLIKQLRCLVYVNAIMDEMQVLGSVNTNPESEGGRSVALSVFSICQKEATMYGAAVQVFKNWADRNPDKWNVPAAMGVSVALREQWPCDFSDSAISGVRQPQRLPPPPLPPDKPAQRFNDRFPKD
jgi:hypothetical protein